jgi:TPR repeat protein
LERAANYLKLAVDQGNGFAPNDYGICLKKDEGVSKDLEGAAHYLRPPVNQGQSR